MTTSTIDDLMASQLRRIDLCWARFEETGEDRWLEAALAADRAYLRMKERSR